MGNLGMVLRVVGFVAAASATVLLGACSGESRSDDASNAGTGGSAGGGNAGFAGRAGSSGTSSGGVAGVGAAGAGGTAAGAGAAGAGGTAAGAAGASGQAGGTGGDGSPGGRWAGCPSADDYAGEEGWTNTLAVTEGATYCATFHASRTLKEVLAKKALLRIAPGTYRLPPDARENLGLPVCIAYGEHGTGVAPTPVGITHTTTPISDEVSHHYQFASVAPDPDRKLGISLYRTLESGADFAFTLDGRPNTLPSLDPQTFDFVLCQSLEATCYHDRSFDSCTHQGSTLNRHEITFEGGKLVLDLRIGTAPAGTEPGAFVRAAGTFRGESFEQTNYFRLIYRPAHHHFERDFAVLFDEPIDGACGLEVDGLVGYDEGTPPIGSTVTCELDPIEPLVIENFSVTSDP